MKLETHWWNGGNKKKINILLDSWILAVYYYYTTTGGKAAFYFLMYHFPFSRLNHLSHLVVLIENGDFCCFSVGIAFNYICSALIDFLFLSSKLIIYYYIMLFNYFGNPDGSLSDINFNRSLSYKKIGFQKKRKSILELLNFLFEVSVRIHTKLKE